MILLHRLNGQEFWLNQNNIEVIEKTPDTVIRLTNQSRYLVQESVQEVVERIIAFKTSIFSQAVSHGQIIREEF